MEWLTYADALKVAAPAEARTIVPQVISLVADVRLLAAEIPTPAELVPVEYGPPGPMKQWSGRIRDRLFIVECEAKDSPHNSVLIRTGFLHKQDELGDWVVLMDLQDLPKSIHIRRPLFIESRQVAPRFVVYRPDPQGWKTAVYKAASRTDAENLLAFMTQDGWNAGCFVGEPAPLGKWAIVQGDRAMSGTSSELNDTLRFACQWSLRYPPAELQVKDISGYSKEIYVVRDGRVLQASDRY